MNIVKSISSNEREHVETTTTAGDEDKDKLDCQYRGSPRSRIAVVAEGSSADEHCNFQESRHSETNQSQEKSHTHPLLPGLAGNGRHSGHGGHEGHGGRGHGGHHLRNEIITNAIVNTASAMVAASSTIAKEVRASLKISKHKSPPSTNEVSEE